MDLPVHGENACHNMAVIELIECWVHSLAEVCNVASQCAFWVCGVLFWGGQFITTLMKT